MFLPEIDEGGKVLEGLTELVGVDTVGGQA